MTKSETNYNLITILGHTAAGKTTVAAHLAYQLQGAVLSADSRQVYKKMDIGTGKDLADYVVNGQNIPYHLIDIVEAGNKYNVFEFQSDFFQAYARVQQRQQVPIMCGGTGMYLESVLKGYKLIQVPVNQSLRNEISTKTLEELKQMLSEMKQLHNTTDVDTHKRAIRAIEIETYYQNNPKINTELPEINSLIIGIKFDRETRRRRISERLQQRFSEGMLDEVRLLLDSGISPDDLIYYGLEYKFLTLHLTHQLTYNEMFRELEKSIHQFAKRQMTWFRGMERKGFVINWLDGYMPLSDKIDQIISWYKH